ncbi:MAG: hypothetical protein FWD57_12695 [Polyangiaceae bacterium]|nr:hypothetical protein [Polyangiaceae bacterium]
MRRNPDLAAAYLGEGDVAAGGSFVVHPILRGPKRNQVARGNSVARGDAYCPCGTGGTSVVPFVAGANGGHPGRVLGA